MAETVLTALVQVIFEKSASQVLEEHGLLSGTKKEMENLQSILSTIQAVLEDAEERQVTDKALQNWLRKLKDIAYDADDLMDEYMTEALQHKMKIHDHMEILNCVMCKVSNFFSCSNPLIFRHKMGARLKEMGKRLDAIAGERSKFHLRERIVDRKNESFRRLQTDSSLVESEVYGREEDKQEIINFLLDDANDRDNVSVIPIVGMGGLGKTTLAKLAYNDEKVVKLFDKRIWVCVSQDFDVKVVIRAIIESAIGNRCDLLDLEPMWRRLQDLLHGKRFLLALDDVWNDDHEKWDRLKQLLRCGCKGSRIIVTTRNEKVGLIMGTVGPYRLRYLSEDDCWSLFKQRAYQFRQAEEASNLLAIGREIVKKCGGLPLAAKVLGSLMCFKRDKSEWLSVKDSETWDLIGDENGILPVLRLSYNDLPSHLQQCFAYCSLFPKDYMIKKEKLIHLWMAEGFIRSSEGSKPLEEVGNEYFNELLWRSFFQEATKDGDGNILECKMHDLVHDLARSVAGVDCSILEVTRRLIIPIGTRHSSLVCNRSILRISNSLTNAKSLRSFLLLFGSWKIKKVSRGIISSFRSLRVLDLSGTGIQKLSKSIGTLKHLRYLDLSDTLIKILPNSISCLCNLQTLKLTHCNRLIELPRDTRKLLSLRHLDIRGCGSLIKLPTRIGELSYLQTLPTFIVGKEIGCFIAELQSLNLRGELTIKNVENVRTAMCAKEANLKEKRNLQSIGFSWEHADDAIVRQNVEKVLEGLRPHSDLKRLCIENYGGAKFPSWLMNLTLSNLETVSLIKCKRCVHLPPLGQLSTLKVLTVDEMDAVMYLSNNSHSNDRVTEFSLLQQLILRDMPNLVGWSFMGGRGLLPCLRKLTIDGCPNLISLPCLPSLENLELSDCNTVLLSSASRNITSLSTLKISAFLEQVSLPEDLLQNNNHLVSLEIWDCPKLKSLSDELEGLSSLRSLSISNCRELDSLPEALGSLTSLESLLIHGCHSLISLPNGIRGLTSLQSMSLSNCDNLASLPEAMQHLIGLQTLHIWSCCKLVSLPEWLGSLTSLRELEIWYCDNLFCLPEGIQCLFALQFLSIWGCPHLEMRCEKDIGEDWHKIAHVPFIKINGPYIQALDGLAI